jgi:hypothetical protein
MLKHITYTIAAVLLGTALLLSDSIPSGAQSSSISALEVDYLLMEETNLKRILPDLVPGRYWLLFEQYGLGLMDESSSGEIRITMFPIGSVQWADGPDSRGKIYLTSYSWPDGPGIIVFNCATLTREDFHALDGIDYADDIGISVDETKLYVAGAVWPVRGEGYTPGEFHPDSGRLLEVDIETLEVLRQAAVGQEPDSIHLTDDYVYVDTSQYAQVVTVEEGAQIGMGQYVPTGSLTDSVDTGSFERVKRFACNELAGRFIDWDEERGLFAQCNPRPAIHMPVPQEYEGIDLMPPGVIIPPEYDDGLWIFDPAVNAVVSTFGVVDDTGFYYGVSDAVVSKVHPGVLYVTAQSSSQYDFMQHGEYNVIAIDMESGDFLAGTKVDFYPYRIFELDDGRLLVSGEFQTVAIIRPVE